MIGLEKIRKIMNIVLSSNSVTGCRPISSCLIAPSDAGKSELVLQNIPKSTRILNDFSYAALIPILQEPEETRPTRIIVPDFNMVLGHKPTVATLTCAMLLGLMGEGLSEIPGVNEHKAKVKISSIVEQGVSMAISTAMTPDMFRSKRGKWRETGFLRRLLPIYYEYGTTTIEKIQNHISGNEELPYQKRDFDLPSRKKISISEKYAHRIEKLSEETRSDRLVWYWYNKATDSRTSEKHKQTAIDYPFTLQRIFIAYVKASANIRHRAAVTEKDMENLEELREFVRYDHPKQI